MKISTWLLPRFLRCCRSLAIVSILFALCSPAMAAGRLLLVDQSGHTAGASLSIAEAVAIVEPGDTIRLVPGSGPYRETLDIKTYGTDTQPIIFDGSGETITGFDSFEFTLNPQSGQWEYRLPTPIINQTPGAFPKPFNHLVTYRGQRLFVSTATFAFTSEFAVLSEDGLTLILKNASPTEGWEIGVRKFVVKMGGFGGSTAAPIAIHYHHIYRNIRASGSTQDGFNIHGTGVDIKFENIEGFNNFDEGFSAHDFIDCEVDGGLFWGNDNGLYNQSSEDIVFTANNVRSYGNLGFGIAARQGVNRITNSVAWDNGQENITLGGALTAYSNTAYTSRWSKRAFVAYQESQDMPFGSIPYAYWPNWKGQPADPTHQAYILTGEEPDIVSIDKAPPFPLAFEDWRYLYFDIADVGDTSISGRDADPDQDGYTNSMEYESGTDPLTIDAPRATVSVSVPNTAIGEGASEPGLYVVSRSGPVDSAMTVFLETTGTAQPLLDYWPLPGSVVIDANATSVEVPLYALRDLLDDPDETVTLRVLADAAYATGQASGTIIIDPSARPVVSISAIDASASEADNETGTFRILRNGSTDQPLTVHLDISGTATPGADYPALADTIVIQAGRSSVDLVVDPVIDSIEEPTEFVQVEVLEDEAYTVAASIAVVAIEGIALPTVSLVASEASASEGPILKSGIFTISRSSGMAEAMTVHYSIGGTATNGIDYDTLAASAVIPAGAATVDVVITPIYDAVSESSETVLLTLKGDLSYGLATQRAATVTIANYTLPLLTVVANDSSASEAANNPGMFTISRTGGTTTPITVAFQISGTATNGLDYSHVDTMAVIPVGARSATVVVQPLPDSLVEGKESVILNLAAGTTYTLGTATSATVNITDVPPTVTLSVPDASASEAAGNTGMFTVSRKLVTADALTVNLAIAGTASNGVDYESIASTLTIPAGALSANVIVSPIADSLVEGAESVVLTIAGSPSYVLSGLSSGTVNITDIAPATVSVITIDGSASEAGNNPGRITVSRTGSKTEVLLVQLNISGTATNGVDYESIASSISIPAGASQVVITVSPLPDKLVENPESVIIAVASSSSYTLGATTSGTVTIADVASSTISLSVPTDTTSESGGAPGMFTITRSGSKTVELTVNYTINGTATNGLDYDAIEASVVIPANTTSINVLITPIADALTEGIETVVLQISDGSAYLIGSNSRGTVTISDVAARKSA